MVLLMFSESMRHSDLGDSKRMSFGIEGNRKRPFLRQSQQLACSFWCILSVSVVLPSSMNTKSLSPFWGPRLLAAWGHAAALPDLNKQGHRPYTRRVRVVGLLASISHLNPPDSR